MNQINSKEDKPRGFAGIIANTLIPLNSNTKFKEKFHNAHGKILLNANNVNFAALIIIDEGTVRVEGIQNQPTENMKKQKVGWNAYIEMDTQIFLAIAMNRMSLLGLVAKILTRKVKIRGIRTLLSMLKMFTMLTEEKE